MSYLKFFTFLFITIPIFELEAQVEDKYVLKYNQPASQWYEALPVGNGRLGAMVFGDFNNERIQLNEESLWAGSSFDRNNPNSKKYLKKIQSHFSKNFKPYVIGKIITHNKKTKINGKISWK